MGARRGSGDVSEWTVMTVDHGETSDSPGGEVKERSIENVPKRLLIRF